MSTLLFGQVREGVPGEHDVVRANTFVVSPDTPAAVQQGAPEFDEVETDPNPDLGIVNRQKASAVIPSEKFSPSWADTPAASVEGIANVNRRITTDGTAAQREASGQWGHGTLFITEGIEPVQTLQGAGGYGADYFTVHERDIQGSAGTYMSPAVQDSDLTSSVSASGKTAARGAASAGTWEAFYAAAVG